MNRASQKILVQGQRIYLNAIVIPVDIERGVNPSMETMQKIDGYSRYLWSEGWIREGDEVILSYRDMDCFNSFYTKKLNA